MEISYSLLLHHWDNQLCLHWPDFLDILLSNTTGRNHRKCRSTLTMDSRNHRITEGWGWKEPPWGYLVQLPSSCRIIPGLCPGSWIAPVRETPQRLWAGCLGLGHCIEKFFLMFRRNLLELIFKLIKFNAQKMEIYEAMATKKPYLKILALSYQKSIAGNLKKTHYF